MKRSPLFFLLFLLAAVSSFSQTIDKPVATVKLTKLEVVSLLQFRSDVEKLQTAIGRPLTAEERRQFLDSRVNTLLFFQYCDREKIYATEAEINSAISQAKASLGPGASDAALEAALRGQGVLIDAKTYFRQQLLFRGYLQQKRQADLKALTSPTSDEVLKAYDLAKASLVRPDTVRVSVLYVDLRGLSGDAKAKASDAMRQVASQLKANPGKFDELVLKASDPGSAYKSATSVYVSKSQQYQDLYGAAFMDQVFKLKVGDLSGLIENDAGLQVVRINESLPMKQLALADTLPGQQGTVQDLLMQRLMAEKQSKLLSSIEDDLVASLRKEATVKVYEENLKF